MRCDERTGICVVWWYVVDDSVDELQSKGIHGKMERWSRST
jgi:hypothetical protein